MVNTDITRSLRSRGVVAWLLAGLLMSFYILLYWDYELDHTFFYDAILNYHYQGKEPLSHAERSAIKQAVQNYPRENNNLKPEHLILVQTIQNTLTAQKLLGSVVKLLDPLSYFLRGLPADKWFLYGFLYTVLVLVMGVRFLAKWKRERYQKIRTLCVMAVQLLLAFLLPQILIASGSKEFYFTYFWPLKIEYFLPSALTELPRAMFLWAAMMSFVAVPVLTYFFGKRWYCSWVCGCGALANTAGDDFRHLSHKSSTAWKLEQVTIYSVLALAIGMTIILFINHWRAIPDAFSEFAFSVQKWYFFFITAGFAGVIGTGFYPLAGTRVWCRFGCPQAAILGILQVFFSRFRITTNGGQCISCGNCSTYCEMGIDVRSYAMRGLDIKRASCVGCGICQAVCPRGVLRLENRKL